MLLVEHNNFNTICVKITILTQIVNKTPSLYPQKKYHFKYVDGENRKHKTNDQNS